MEELGDETRKYKCTHAKPSHSENISHYEIIKVILFTLDLVYIKKDKI